jgi:hypothetical protein
MKPHKFGDRYDHGYRVTKKRGNWGKNKRMTCILSLPVIE